MKKKDFWPGIKKVFKKRDSRFWLMIFVVVSTSSFLVLWSINLKDSFSNKGSLVRDIESLNLDDSKIEFNNIFGDLSSLLESLEEEGGDSSLEENEEDEVLNKAQNIFRDFATSSDELTYNESEIEELRRKIEELEEKIKD
jgi:hypothetical protein